MSTPSRWRIAVIALVAASSVELRAQVGTTPSPTADHVEVIRRDAERRIDVLIGGKPFTSYLYSASLKRPLLYPLRAAGGAVVTLGAPAATRDARPMLAEDAGLWFNLGHVNGLDFSTAAAPAAKATGASAGSVVHRALRSSRSGDGEGSIEVTVEWVNAQGKALVKEDVHFIIRAHEGFRSIDRISTVTALDAAITFTNNSRPLVGVRVARALESLPMESGGLEPMTPRSNSAPQRDTSHAAHGAMAVSANPERSRGWWALLTGPVATDSVTFVVLDHPRNAAFPTHWNTGESGLAATNQGRTTGASARSFKLAAGESTTLIHQVLIVNRALPVEELDKYYAGFTGGKP